MDLELRGRTAIVTGATGGIGEACARLLAAEGAAVRLNARDGEALETLAASIRAAGGIAEACPGDLLDRATHERLVHAGAEPDIFVHSASRRFTYAKLHTEGADAAESRRIDEESFLEITKLCVPGMMVRRFGRLVAVTSLASTFGGRASLRYGAAKAAVEGLVRGLATDYGPYGITANAVVPSLVETSRLVGRSSAEMKTKLEETTSLRRFATPAEVAGPIVFLCSPLASYITGSSLAVTGGAHLNNVW